MGQRGEHGPPGHQDATAISFKPEMVTPIRLRSVTSRGANDFTGLSLIRLDATKECFCDAEYEYQYPGCSINHRVAQPDFLQPDLDEDQSFSSKLNGN